MNEYHKWNVNTTGWTFQDYVIPEEIVQFGEFQIGTLKMIPKGTVYMVPNPECQCQTSPIDCEIHAS
jgi:hypothetical protein